MKKVRVEHSNDFKTWKPTGMEWSEEEVKEKWNTLQKIIHEEQIYGSFRLADAHKDTTVCLSCGEFKYKCYCNEVCLYCNKTVYKCISESEDGKCPIESRYKKLIAFS